MSLLHRACASASSVTREHSVKRLLSFLREANFTATGVKHVIKMPSSSKILTMHTEREDLLENTPMC